MVLKSIPICWLFSSIFFKISFFIIFESPPPSKSSLLIILYIEFVKIVISLKKFILYSTFLSLIKILFTIKVGNIYGNYIFLERIPDIFGLIKEWLNIRFLVVFILSISLMDHEFKIPFAINLFADMNSIIYKFIILLFNFFVWFGNLSLMETDLFIPVTHKSRNFSFYWFKFGWVSSNCRSEVSSKCPDFVISKN